MGQARKPLDNVERCIRLSRLLNDPRDVERLEAMAAEYGRAAAKIEAGDAAGLA
jgi:hypothetical protein